MRVLAALGLLLDRVFTGSCRQHGRELEGIRRGGYYTFFVRLLRLLMRTRVGSIYIHRVYNLIQVVVVVQIRILHVFGRRVCLVCGLLRLIVLTAIIAIGLIAEIRVELACVCAV